MVARYSATNHRSSISDFSTILTRGETCPLKKGNDNHPSLFKRFGSSGNFSSETKPSGFMSGIGLRY
ncbi:hypothetical protein X777_02915 [Ooceraea biroi]|uniref:Uncharacterized protein n=1 Tax=Ooceraea biroi TaxID=2015173 RepID=A0A026WKV0_OOCBI|nr:hypothetical protein X777_02915 [Ooceraea biroi]